MAASSEPLPSFKASCMLGGAKGTANAVDATLWAASFYPFQQADESDPVFAVTGGTYTIVCRALLGKSSPVEELLRFVDKNENASLNSLAWAKDTNSGDPMLCVTGALPTIKIFNITTRRLVRTLAGHGAPINDLAVPKTNPTLLASASEDHTIRIWSLDPHHANQPCTAIFAGGGHRAGLHTIDFHATEKFLISGGMDTFINLWTVPEFPNERPGTFSPEQIHYPHFSTAEVHSDKIDTIKFHTDLILSSAATIHTIILWRILGFNSSTTPPGTLPAAPTSTPETFSAFGSGWEPLLTFSIPDTADLWFRFSLFSAPGRAAVLAAGNSKGKCGFWDLGRLEGGIVGREEVWKEAVKSKGGRKKKKGPGVVMGMSEAARAGSVVSSRAEESSLWSSPAPGEGGNGMKGVEQDVKSVGGPLKPQPPHKIVVLPNVGFYGLQAAWSECGRWCILAGQGGEVAVMDREMPIAQ